MFYHPSDQYLNRLYEAFQKLTLATGRVRQCTQRTHLIDTPMPRGSESVANYHDPAILLAVSPRSLNLPSALGCEDTARQAPSSPYASSIKRSSSRRHFMIDSTASKLRCLLRFE